MQKKIKYTKFLKYFTLVFTIFITYHITVWSLYTSQIFSRADKLYIGDLGRMSYQTDSLFPRKLEYTLSKKHLNHGDIKNKKIDILTVGDSFSNAEMGGLNPYYQDYLATKYNKNVLNIIKLRDNAHVPFELILTLYNNGWLKKHKPEMIIIQSSERSVYKRFAKEFDFSFKDLNTTSIFIKTKTKNSYIPELLPINTANYKLPFYTLMYKIKSKGSKNVARVTLNRDLFSTKNYKNELLFHFDDVKNIHNDLQSVKLINNNFNKLSTMLKTLNIKLVFMPAVDKYDLYSSFIVNNPYPKNIFFETIRTLKKDYYFVDTKKILLESLNNNTKDIYYSDDTHWSYKASELISQDEIFSKNLQ